MRRLIEIMLTVLILIAVLSLTVSMAGCVSQQQQVQQQVVVQAQTQQSSDSNMVVINKAENRERLERAETWMQSQQQTELYPKRMIPLEEREVYITGSFREEAEYEVIKVMREAGYSVNRSGGRKSMRLEIRRDHLSDRGVYIATLYDRNNRVVAQGKGEYYRNLFQCYPVIIIREGGSEWRRIREERGEVRAAIEAVARMIQDHKGAAG